MSCAAVFIFLALRYGVCLKRVPWNYVTPTRQATTHLMESPELWKKCQSGDDLARDQLLLRHLQLVHHVVRQLMRSGHLDAEFDDLVSAGTIGLIKAIENFDLSRGLAFSTFATHRIRGAILDDLRRRDHAPRSIRRKQREISQAADRLQATHDRIPTDQELADEIGIDLSELWRWQREAEQAVRVSINRPLDATDDRSPSAEEILTADDPRTTGDFLLKKEEIQILRDEILKLKEQERTVLALYYYEELKLHEIAKILGVTESRISQIRSAAVKSLKSRLSGPRGVVAS